MKRNIALAVLSALGFVLVLALGRVPRTRAAQVGGNCRILVTEPIDEQKLIILEGNTRPEANARNDRGRVEETFPMDHMLLQLKRPPELEQALDEYLQQLTDKKSPNYHKWLTPEQLGDLYGPSQTDLLTVRGWLESHGFSVGKVYPNGMVIDFSGTAGQIREAFHTEIHYLEVRGQRHFANMSDPRIPLALAPVVVGVVSLNNFKPQPQAVPRTNYTFSGCGGSCYALVPADIETIYNLNPLYAQNILGQGQTVVVVEDSDTYENDVATYISTFLSKYSGSVVTVHPEASPANPNGV